MGQEVYVSKIIRQAFMQVFARRAFAQFIVWEENRDFLGSPSCFSK